MTLEITPEALQQIITNAVSAAISVQSVASVPNTASPPQVQPEKPRRPTISSGTSLEKWSYFLTKWKRYKAMTGYWYHRRPVDKSAY